jgi:hypothetical protein
MTDASGDLSRYEAPAGELDYPIDCVIGIVPVEHVAGLIDAARAEGVDDDAVRIVPPDRRDDFAVQLRGGGVKGAVRRLISSTGGDLDLITALIRDLQPGRLAVAIRVGDHDDGLKDRIATAFQQHRGIHVNYLGKRAIETLDGEMLG